MPEKRLNIFDSAIAIKKNKHKYFVDSLCGWARLRFPNDTLTGAEIAVERVIRCSQHSSIFNDWFMLQIYWPKKSNQFINSMHKTTKQSQRRAKTWLRIRNDNKWNFPSGQRDWTNGETTSKREMWTIQNELGQSQILKIIRGFFCQQKKIDEKNSHLRNVMRQNTIINSRKKKSQNGYKSICFVNFHRFLNLDQWLFRLVLFLVRFSSFVCVFCSFERDSLHDIICIGIFLSVCCGWWFCVPDRQRQCLLPHGSHAHRSQYLRIAVQ